MAATARRHHEQSWKRSSVLCWACPMFWIWSSFSSGTYSWLCCFARLASLPCSASKQVGGRGRGQLRRLEMAMLVWPAVVLGFGWLLRAWGREKPTWVYALFLNSKPNWIWITKIIQRSKLDGDSQFSYAPILTNAQSFSINSTSRISLEFSIQLTVNKLKFWSTQTTCVKV